MTLGVVFFCSEYRSCLKYSVKNTNHHLFVQLWTLFQHCRTMEIIQSEEVRSSFCSFCSDLRGMNFCKTFFIQELSEASYDSFLNFKLRSFPYVPKRNGTIVQLRFQWSVQFPLWNSKWKAVFWHTEYFYLTQTDFNSVRCLLWFGQFSCYFYCSGFS